MTIIAGLELLLIAYLIYTRPRDLAGMIALTDRLAQRIQAPEQAILEHTISETSEHAPPAVFPDDDEGHWEAKDELAARLMRDELASA